MRAAFAKFIDALTKKERVTLISAGILFVISAIAVFVIANTKEGSIPEAGGTYTEGIIGQPSFINPVLATTDIDKTLVRLIFSNVVELAQKITYEEDGRKWVIRLKDNIMWHDGKPVTTDDVMFTIRKIQDPDSRSPLSKSWQGVLVERVSERELIINLGVSYSFFEDTLRALYIMPQHLFENIPVANWRISELNLNPIGSGPYAFAGREKTNNGFINSYTLKPHPFSSEENMPLIAEWKIRFFEEKSELITAYNNGRIDGMPGLEYEDLSSIQRPYTLTRFLLPHYYAIFFNQSQNLALKDVLVRRALSKAIQKEELTKSLFGEEAAVLHGPIPPHIPYIVPRQNNISSSQNEAAELLDEAQWIMGDDGLRRKKIGKDEIILELELTVPQVSFLQKTATFILTEWKNIGVKTTIRELSLPSITNGIIKNRDYQAILFGNVLTPRADLFSFWHSSQKFYPGLNISLYDNKRVDTLIESIRQDIDSTRRRTQFDDAQSQIIEDQPAIFLYSPYYLMITARHLRGIDGGFIGEPSDRVENAPAWHVRTRR